VHLGTDSHLFQSLESIEDNLNNVKEKIAESGKTTLSPIKSTSPLQRDPPSPQGERTGHPTEYSTVLSQGVKRKLLLTFYLTVEMPLRIFFRATEMIVFEEDT